MNYCNTSSRSPEAFAGHLLNYQLGRRKLQAKGQGSGVVPRCSRRTPIYMHPDEVIINLNLSAFEQCVFEALAQPVGRTQVLAQLKPRVRASIQASEWGE